MGRNRKRVGEGGDRRPHKHTGHFNRHNRKKNTLIKMKSATSKGRPGGGGAAVLFNVNKTNRLGVEIALEKPVVCGYYSLNSQREYSHDLTQLKYIVMPEGPEIDFDLHDGYEQAIHKDDVDEKLHNLLKWVLQQKIQTVKDGLLTFPDTDFICYRGLLTMLMCTPYEKNDDWIIYAVKWKNVIYLCNMETEKRKKERLNCPESVKHTMAWGYKFEQYMTANEPGGEPDTQRPVNEKEEQCVMFRSAIKNKRLLYGAEIDGVLSDKPVTNLQELAEADMVELKTAIFKPRDAKQEFILKRFKFIKWWAQSHLVGIKKLICGQRVLRFVRLLEEYSVDELASKNDDHWNPAVCLSFLNTTLDFIQDTMSNADSNTLWKFEWRPRNNVMGVVVSEPGVKDYLPSWFTEASCWEGTK